MTNKNYPWNIAFLICILFASLSSRANECDCKQAFQATAKAYEENYSLFHYKVTEANQNLYDAHKEVIMNQALTITNLKDCKKLLDRYLQYFRDGHTYILPPDQKEFYKEKLEITESEFKKLYETNNFHLNPIFGIWDNGSVQVMIMPNPKGLDRARDYVGIVLNSTLKNWGETDVKFELIEKGGSLQANFIKNDFSIEETSGRLNGKFSLEFEGFKVWKKIWPEAEDPELIDEIKAKYNEFHISYIDSIPYLRLPDFYSVERSFVDSLMKSHHQNIIKADFMVVDVRGNSGGNDGTYFPVLPYLLDGPIEMPMNGFWLSEYNSKMIISALAAQKGMSLEEYKLNEKKDYEAFTSNIGKAYFEYPDKSWTFKTDTIFNGPKKVIVLADKETASSGETFVYRVNQSNKVVVYGQNTAGVVDGFNGLPMDIGCFEVVFPSSYRASDIEENPIDPYGIAPDVYINEKEEVLEYAFEHMRQLHKLENNNIK